LLHLIERAVHVASIRFLENRQLREQKSQNISHSSPENISLLSSLVDRTLTRSPSSKNSFNNGIDKHQPLENNLQQEKQNFNNTDTNTTTPMNLITQDFLAAQKNFIPASLKGIKLHKSNVTWDDIGGLIQHTSFPFVSFFLHSLSLSLTFTCTLFSLSGAISSY
jgi:peroxin-1